VSQSSTPFHGTMVEKSPTNFALLLSGTNQSLMFAKLSITEPVIVNRSTVNIAVFISVIIPLLFSILVVNIMSIILTKQRESTLVNTLLTMDCMANALITVINSIQHYKNVGLELYCAPVTVLYSRCFVKNKRGLCICKASLLCPHMCL
jgi:hypothetical protein